MTVLLSKSASDSEFLKVATDWLNLISEGKYQDAFALTLHDPYYLWSPDLIEKTVKGYGLPEPHPSGKVFLPTPPSSTTGNPPDRWVERYSDAIPAKFADGEIIGELMHTVPLDGQWSDLTVTFALVRVSDGISLCLNEIHVF